MTKTSLKKKVFLFCRLFSNLLFTLFFALQPSAQAFVDSLQYAHSATAPSSSSLPSQMVSISNKFLLETALLSIESESSQIRPAVSTPSNPIVSIYSYEIKHRKFTRLVFASVHSSEGYPYQAYELTGNNALGRLMETGKMINGKFIRERIYDYKTQTITLYNSKNIYEKRIYKLKANGEPGRPYQYRGRTEAGDLINVRFLYQNDSVICLHLNGMSFAVYALSGNGQLGELLEIGTARGLNPKGQLLAKTRIEIQHLKRQGAIVPVYVFHERNGVKVTRERDVQNLDGLGSVGRILRFTSADIDFEYFYHDAVNGGPSSVKVLNHRAGESLTFEVAKKDLNDSSGQLRVKESLHRDQLAQAISNLSPSISKMTEGIYWKPSELKRLPMHARLNEETWIWEKLLRGPPVFETTLLSSAFALISSVLSFAFSLPFFPLFNVLSSSIFVFGGVSV